MAGPPDELRLPEGSQATDWEMELAIVIGSTCRQVPQAQAQAQVAGYCLANDLSERSWQTQRNGQWTKGKSFDGLRIVSPPEMATSHRMRP
ncbi:fumarylacetoacetate hydrolase family protein [Azohydromonas caseinilytica]|uniref:Fumarylacetoacetase-like C-terminal domain-containing protein n=1 Tax=Azohydromonas caseinilytica TaxID=2728836 RepID=A0A848FDD8_9BURK|nr:fumarylacetoacetate hydrolase family protein [Azohydromonas caseinilytica]NML17322.1 hypothetical protein [Azohydromonas caseinilytica]